MPQYPLVMGKFVVPGLRSGTVPRQRLLDLLDGDARLSLVIAPAGWGKTTVLAQWANAVSGHRPVAWLSLDDSDDEPIRFWSYVASALRAAVQDVGEAALSALAVPSVDPLDVAVPSLLNDLARAAAGPPVLVLDDYHVLADRRIHEAVEFLLAYLPPSARGWWLPGPIRRFRWRGCVRVVSCPRSAWPISASEPRRRRAGRPASSSPCSHCAARRPARHAWPPRRGRTGTSSTT